MGVVLFASPPLAADGVADGAAITGGMGAVLASPVLGCGAADGATVGEGVSAVLTWHAKLSW